MGILGLVGNSFGCSATGERLVSAARDGDLQEAKALLEYNPCLAKYSTIGVRNSPLHYSAAKGHHEIVALLIESGVDINLRNYRGQTALMQACQSGHWEVVQTLILFKANIHRADYLNGGTALHLAALNGHSQCIPLLLADIIPSTLNFRSAFNKTSKENGYISVFNEGALQEVINRPSDGGVTALHMAALSGHAETVHLLLDLGASVSQVTVGDGSTIDLIGPGSTPLHYAACGGNAQCCQLLIAAGASLATENGNGWTPLMVAHSWHRDGMEDILREQPRSRPMPSPSPFLCLPLMSIVAIARDCGWRSINSPSTFFDPCVVCLERKCTVAAEGCSHEFCIPCALYLCSTNTSTTVARRPPGSIACPLCRHGIVSFTKLPGTSLIIKETARTSLSLSLCSLSSGLQQTSPLEAPFCKSDHNCARLSPSGSSFRSLSCRKLPSVKLNPSICIGASEISSCLVPRNSDRGFTIQQASLRRSASQSHNQTRRG